MKRFLLIASVALATMFSVNVMAAGVGAVDMQKVFASAPELKALQGTLVKKFSGQRAKLMKMVKSLQDQQRKLQRNQSVMTSSAVTKLKAKIVEGQNQLQLAQSKYQQAVVAAQSQLMRNFIDKVRASSKAVARRKGFDMVLVNTAVLYAKNSQDVTDKVIAGLSD